MKEIRLFVITTLLATFPHWTAVASQPNILRIFTDDQGGGDLGCYGNQLIQTPRLDPLAKEGTLFSNFYAQPVWNPEQPFLLYLAHTMMHTNIDASPAFKGTSKGGLYGAVVEEFDFETGRLIDQLDSPGLSENTLVIYTSDNGSWSQPRYTMVKTGRLRLNSDRDPRWFMPDGSIFWGDLGALGAKGSAYEEGSRVPAPPGNKKGNRT